MKIQFNVRRLFITFSCISIFLVVASIASAQTEKPVVVTNTASNPVPTAVTNTVNVRNVDNAAKQPFQAVWQGGSSFPTVPDGKVFVVEHLSGRFRVPSAMGSTMLCRFMQLSVNVGTPNDIDVIPTFMGTAASISNDLNFFSFSQPVRAYASANSDLGALSFSLSQGCSGFPTVTQVVLTGHLENVN